MAVIIPEGFNHKSPDYRAVLQLRLERLQRIRANKDPQALLGLFAYYRDNPIQFIVDWGCTFDPRNANIPGMPTVMPFILYPRQVEFCEWVLARMSAREDGLCDKSRDEGASWLMVALFCTLCLFRDGFTAGCGSRKEEYVDKLDSPKALFWKARLFMKLLPPEFRRGWLEDKHAPHMRLVFPATGAYLTGEAGDNIGRGDRTSVYLVDESAHLEHPEAADAALQATTDCRVDVSSVKGMANSFARKRFSWEAHKIFTLHWSSNPRKLADDGGAAWYASQKAKAPSPAILAQEVDISYTASVEGVVIPNEWVRAAVDAHLKIAGMNVGAKRGALDVADEGIDRNSFVGAHGVVLYYAEEWSGKGSDIYDTAERAVAIADAEAMPSFRFDSDGLGAGVRGDVRKINEGRKAKGLRAIDAEPFRGSEAVANPDDPMPTAFPEARGKDKDERTNKDMFKNRKAQAWWDLRVRFQRTYRAVTEGHVYDPSTLISLASTMPRLQELTMQLSQPTYSLNGAGQMVIDKKPDGSKSPNDADAVMILLAPAERKARSFFS